MACSWLWGWLCTNPRRVRRMPARKARRLVQMNQPIEPPYDEKAAQEEFKGYCEPSCKGWHAPRTLPLLLLCLLTLLAGCTINFDAEPLHAPIAPGVNRLDADAMKLYREVWGDWLREHRYRPRPEPQELTVNGTGEPWLFVSNCQGAKP